jgi:hypothetical protein
MPVTTQIRNNSVSRDALAGYDQNAKIKSAYERIGAVANDVNALKSTPWKRVWDIIPRFVRNLRTWIMAEQQTAHFGGAGLEEYVTEIPGIGTWFDLRLASFQPPGGGVVYPVANSHVDTTNRSGSYTIWRAPQAGDYLVTMYFKCITNATAGDDYAIVQLSYRENETAAWQAPIEVCGAANQAVTDKTRIECTGTYLVRMPRGSQLRFGAKQGGKSGGTPSPNAIDPQTLEVRVSIQKQKFYPTLKT